MPLRSLFSEEKGYNLLLFDEPKGDAMLYDEEDDFLVGTPQSKFFDILFHANREIVKNKLLQCIDRYNAMELLLEQHLGEEAFSQEIQKTLLNESDTIVERNNDLFIAMMGEILSQNE